MVRRKKRSQKKNVRKRRITLPVVIAIVVIILIFFGMSYTYSAGLVSTSTREVGAPTGQAITPKQPQCKEVQEAYTEQIPYQEEEPYMYYLNAQVISASQDEKFNLQFGYYEESDIKLKNIDNQAGWFTITVSWKTLYRSSTDTVRHYIEPDKIVDFVSIFNKNMGEDITYTYTYISDPVTKTRWVTKYRTETKYRTVTKCD